MKYFKILLALLIFNNVGFTSNYINIDLEAYLDRCEKIAAMKKQKEEEQNGNIYKTNNLLENIVSKVENNEQIYYANYKYNPTSESIVDSNAEYNYCYLLSFYKSYNKKTQNNTRYYYERVKVGEKNNKKDCAIF